MRRILVVANQTLGGEELLRTLDARNREDPIEVVLVVPATRPSDQRQQFTPSLNSPASPDSYLRAEAEEARAVEMAQRRLDDALDALRRRGIPATGEVGDADAMHAVTDAMSRQRCDEVVISTLPIGVSRWLGQDLPHRVGRKLHVPVSVVTAPALATR